MAFLSPEPPSLRVGLLRQACGCGSKKAGVPAGNKGNKLIQGLFDKGCAFSMTHVLRHFLRNVILYFKVA